MPLSGPPAVLNSVAASNADSIAGSATNKHMTPAGAHYAQAAADNVRTPRGGIAFDGTASAAIVAALTGQSIGTDEVSMVFTMRVPTVNPATTQGASGVWVGSSNTAPNAARSLSVSLFSTGEMYIVLRGATGSDFRFATIANVVADYAGQVILVALVRSSAGIAVYINRVAQSLSADTTGGTPPAWTDSITSTYLGIGYGLTSLGTTDQPFFSASLYNGELTAGDEAEIFSRGGAVPFRFQYGSQAVLNSGTFALGKRYRIVSRTDGDFTTVGAADNNVGTEFTATATGAGILDAGDTVVRIGAIAHYALDEGIGYQLHDSSPNKLDAVMTTTGVHHLIPRREGFVRTPGAGLSWAGTHESKSLLGVAQRALPDGAVLTLIARKASAGSSGSGCTLGSTNSATRWQAADTFTTAKELGTVANSGLPAGTADADTDLLLDPDTANITATIAVEVHYKLTEGT